VVAHVMSQYWSDLYVQEHACITLGLMTSFNVKTQTQAHKLGLIEVVIKLARGNIDHVNVQRFVIGPTKDLQAAVVPFTWSTQHWELIAIIEWC